MRTFYYHLVTSLFLFLITLNLQAQNGLQFDGTDDKATVTHHADFDFGINDFTIEANLTNLQAGADQTILSKRTSATNGFSFHISTTTQQLTLALDDNTLSITDTAIQTGQCLWVAAKRSNDSIFLYVNDTLYFAGINNKNINQATDLLFGIDGATSGTKQPLQATIESIHIWNIARSDTAISSGSNSCLTGSETNLVGYWDMEEATGVYAHDISNSHHAYLGNSVYADQADPSWQTTSCITTSCCSTVADFQLPTTPTANYASQLANSSTNADSIWWIVNGDTTQFSDANQADLILTFALGTNTVQLIAFGQGCIDIKTTLVDVIPQLAPCGADELDEWRKVNDPNYYRYLQQIVAVAQANQGAQARPIGGVYKIPVVFHMVAYDSATLADFPLSRIQEQLDTLNYHFAANNVNIEFCLAQKMANNRTDWNIYNDLNPNQSIPGVTYTIDTTLAEYDPFQADYSIELQDSFALLPNARYMNVYVVEKIIGFGVPAGVLGISSLGPSTIGDQMAIIHPAFVGGNSYPLGKVLVHEVGHWLSLFHVFENDLICDTYDQPAPTGGSVSNCSTAYGIPFPAACSSATPYNQGEDHMDYALESCLNKFTQGQKDRMEGTLANIRTFIHSEANLISTGVWQQGGCIDSLPLTAQFHLDEYDICAGIPVTATGVTIPITAWEYKTWWDSSKNNNKPAPYLPNPSIIATSGSSIPTTTFAIDSPGVWSIILSVYDTSTASLISDTVDINILDCSPGAARNRVYMEFDSSEWEVTNMSLVSYDSIDNDPQKGYLIAGTGINGNQTKGVLINTDLAGQLRWRKEIAITDENVRILDITKDITYNGTPNCYALTGNISTANKTESSPLLIIIDRLGNILLQKNYPISENGTPHPFGLGFEVVQATNEDLLLVGMTGDGIDTAFSKSGFILGIDNNTGSLIWNHTYTSNAFNLNPLPNDYDAVGRVIEIEEDFGNGLEAAYVVMGSYNRVNSPVLVPGTFLSCFTVSATGTIDEKWRTNIETFPGNPGHARMAALAKEGNRLFGSAYTDFAHTTFLFEINTQNGTFPVITEAADFRATELIIDDGHCVVAGYNDSPVGLTSLKVPLPDSGSIFWNTTQSITRSYDGTEIGSSRFALYNPYFGLKKPHNLVASPNEGYMIVSEVELSNSASIPPSTFPTGLVLNKIDDLLISACDFSTVPPPGLLFNLLNFPIYTDTLLLDVLDDTPNSFVTALTDGCYYKGCTPQRIGGTDDILKCTPSDSISIIGLPSFVSNSNLIYQWFPTQYLNDSTTRTPITWTPVNQVYEVIITDTSTQCEYFRKKFNITIEPPKDTTDICIPCLSDLPTVYQYDANASNPHTINIFQLLTQHGLPTNGNLETLNPNAQSFLTQFYDINTGILNFPGGFNIINRLVYKYNPSNLCGDDIAYINLGVKSLFGNNANPNLSTRLDICDGDSITFTSIDTFGNNNTTREWQIFRSFSIVQTTMDSLSIGYRFFDNPNATGANPDYIVRQNVTLDSCNGDAFLYNGVTPITASSDVSIYITPPTTTITADPCTNTLIFSGFAAPQDTIQWYEVSTGLLAGETNSTLVVTTAGDYYATIQSRLGCIGGTDTFSFTPNNTPLAAAISSSTDPSCNGVLDGNITVLASGGTTPYSYLWSDGQTTATASGLGDGIYTLTVTDLCGSTVTLSDTLDFAPAITLTLTGTDPLCNGDNNGSATATVAGGTTPYQYDWNNGQTTATAINLIANTYTVTVTDNNGCSITDNLTLTQPAVLSTSISSQTNLTCANTNVGSITWTTTGGTPNYSYDIGNGGQTSNSFSNLAAGNYTVTVTDDNGCTTTASATITSPAALQTTATITDVDCAGNTTGFIATTTTGGVPSYTYSWSNGQSGANNAGLGAGNYTLTLTDANGCVAINTFTINEPALLQPNLVANDINCNIANSGTITTNVTGGTTPYSYSWSTAATSASINNLTAGTYCVTITDDNGCTTTDCGVVNNPPNPITISKTVVQDTVAPNSYFDYTITITNNCSTDYNITVLDTLPIGLQLINSGGLAYDNNTRILSDSTLLLGGTTQSFDITVRPLEVASCGSTNTKVNLASAMIHNDPSSLVLDSVAIHIIDTAAANSCSPVLADSVNFSDAIQAGVLSASPSSQTIVIAGTWIVDNSHTFTNATILMQPGAEIVVPNGSNLTLNNTTIQAACPCLWHRIRVEDGGSLITENGTIIKDAQYAIEARDGSQIPRIANTTFDANFIGIYIPPKSQGNIVNFGTFENNVFKSRNLLPNFGGIQGTPMLDNSQTTTLISPPTPTQPQLTRGIAGMLLWDANAINLSTNNPSSSNEFHTLVAGIVLLRTDLETNSCYFHAIREGYNDYNPNLEFHGCGIHLQTDNSTHSLVFEGMLQQAGQHPFSFDDCDIGVSSRGGNTRVIHAAFESNSVMGIRTTQCYQSEISIKDNNLHDQEGVGIGLFDHGLETAVIIAYNSIVIDNQATVNNQFRAGIQSVSDPAQSHDLTIAENDIIAGDAQFGITITGFRFNKTIIVEDNGITLDGGQTIQRAGIGIFDSEINLQCNNIEGNNTNLNNSQNFGIFGSIIPNGEIKCNLVNRTQTGVFLDGVSDLNFKGNKFDEHETGLLLSSTAVIGQQDNHGNIWTGNTANYGGVDATNLNGNGVFASRFFIDGQPSLTPNNYPNNITPGWFTIQGGNVFDCNSPKQVCSFPVSARPMAGSSRNNNTANTTPSLSLVDSIIASGGRLSSQYSTTTAYTGQRMLYHKLRQYPRLNRGQFFQQFASIHKNSCVGHFDSITQVCKRAYSWSAADQQLLAQLRQQSQGYLDTIRGLDSMLATRYSPNTWNTRNGLARQLQLVRQQQTSVLQRIQHSQQAQLNQANLQNTNFVPLALYEALEQQVNHIYLNTLAKGIVTFDTHQLATLRVIASHCPQEGGAAVHHARSMLSMVEQVNLLDYNCREVIPNGGDIQTKPQPKGNSTDNTLVQEWEINLFPNPADRILHINSNLALEKETRIEIYNSMGQLVQTKTTNTTTDILSIDVSKLMDGMYTLRLSNQNHTQTKSFVISKR